MIAAAIEARVEAASESTQTLHRRAIPFFKTYHDLLLLDSFTEISNMVNPALPSRPEAPQLTTTASSWRANVTPVVAAHLLHFGVAPEVFNVLQNGELQAAELKEQFGDNLRITSRPGTLRRGDVVVLDATKMKGEGSGKVKVLGTKAQDQILVKVEQVHQGRALHKGVVVMPARGIWGRAASASVLYQSCESS